MGRVTTFEHRKEHSVLTRSAEIFAVHPAGLCAYGTRVVQCMANGVLTVTSRLFTCHFHTHYVRITDMLSRLWNLLLYVCFLICSFTGHVSYGERSNKFAFTPMVNMQF